MDVKQSLRPVSDGWDAVNDAAGITRRALRDRRTRTAVLNAYDQGRRLYADLASDGARTTFGRLARDQSLQDEIAAMVRSASHAVDTSIQAGRRRRRLRKLAGLAVAIGGAIGLVTAWRRSHDGSSAPHGMHGTPATPNGADARERVTAAAG